MWYNGSGGQELMAKQRVFLSVLILCASATLASACILYDSGSAMPTHSPVRTPLPPPSLKGSRSLEETLNQRRSVRDFDDQPLTAAQIGQLLWAAQGTTNERGFRTAPSAGALYPLELYLVTADGVFRYDPANHELQPTSSQDARPRLFQSALEQEPVRRAPAVFVFTAVYERTRIKYGEERTPRYVHLEAGHAAQNLLLEAVALDLGAVPIGAFHDQEVQSALGLPADHQPLYLIPVGHPAESEP
jgi:SagB-type dehydrogenase family enzyme